jgi:hypothetical protein
MRGADVLKGKAVDASAVGPAGSLEKRGDELAKRITVGAQRIALGRQTWRAIGVREHHSVIAARAGINHAFLAGHLSPQVVAVMVAAIGRAAAARVRAGVKIEYLINKFPKARYLV